MKNIFFALALVCATSCLQAEVSPEVIDAVKSGCAICPTKEENKCGVCGKPKSPDADVDNVDGQEEGDEVKCGCGKPKPGRTAGE
jgi:hypothetical protein